VSVPSSYAEPYVECPKCGTRIATDPEQGIQWRPKCDETEASFPESRLPRGKKKTVADWYLPAGIVSALIGGAAFVASASLGGGNFEGAMLAGAPNPLFLVGVPLGAF
jgi:hypothetical protein